jgi:prepilin-type N-terminal cleavage/methylation domain-containing protein
MKMKKSKGFTLIELMVSIAITALLAVLALNIFLKVVDSTDSEKERIQIEETVEKSSNGEQL